MWVPRGSWRRGDAFVGARGPRQLQIASTGGNTQAASGGIDVTGADEVLLLVSIATNFVDYQTLTADEKARSGGYLSAAQGKAYDALFSSHLAAYQRYFDRVKLNLGSSSSTEPTDARIARFAQSDDPELAALYFQFGRYLLISSSQPGGQPANLQGIWNDPVTPPWDSKYTIKINTEMNYWPAEKTNLSELHEPVLRMVEELSVAGRQTAATMYGADGVVLGWKVNFWARLLDGNHATAPFIWCPRFPTTGPRAAE
jgi:alpha-L-fucosidase 2